MARPLKRRINKSIAYNKETLIGIIIYVNEAENWCNVERLDGTVLYHIPFRAIDYRLRREEQPVKLTEIHGSRQKYVITGESDVIIASTEFADKGNIKWAPDAAKGQWTARYQWK